VPRRSEKKRDEEPLPFWSGTITFGLVSVPVDLFPAVRTHRVPMRTFGPDGAPLVRRYFSQDGDLLAEDDVVRGYEMDNGKYIVVTDEELDKLEPRKSRDIDLRRFVGRDEIPVSMLERHYVLAPGGESTKAYHLLAEAMERDRRAGIATYVMRGREYLVAIYAEHGLLFGATLRFIDELRTPKSVGLPPVAEAPAKDLKEIKSALGKLSERSLDPDLFIDEEDEALLDLAETKQAKSRDLIEVGAIEQDEPDRDNIIDIMSILKARMQGGNQKSGDSKQPDSDESADMRRDELYERAKDLDIKGRSDMSRDELERAVRAAG
jgi:DNA end-binding protein Ku